MLTVRHNGTSVVPGSRGHHRSRMAVALRANNELEPLYIIDEEQSGAPRAAPPTQEAPQQQYYAQKPQQKPQARYAPSMPPMRNRPTVSQSDPCDLNTGSDICSR